VADAVLETERLILRRFRDDDLAAFGAHLNTPAGKRSEDGAEALNPDNLMCRAIKAVRDACGDEIGVLTDVARDPYTSHGQDGLVDTRGYVANDDTVAVLVDQAVL